MTYQKYDFDAENPWTWTHKNWRLDRDVQTRAPLLDRSKCEYRVELPLDH